MKSKLKLGGIVIGIGTSIGASLFGYFKYKDIQKWREEVEAIPYPTANYVGEKP